MSMDLKALVAGSPSATARLLEEYKDREGELEKHQNMNKLRKGQFDFQKLNLPSIPKKEKGGDDFNTIVMPNDTETTVKVTAALEKHLYQISGQPPKPKNKLNCCQIL